jgi:hypothetical protein
VEAPRTVGTVADGRGYPKSDALKTPKFPMHRVEASVFSEICRMHGCVVEVFETEGVQKHDPNPEARRPARTATAAPR